MTLVLDWQKRLGYRQDPFAGNMTPTANFLVGMSDVRERINLFLIKGERFGTISANRGCGKTILLQWINEQLAPSKAHAQQLIDARVLKRDAIVSALLMPRLSFFERKLGSILKKPAVDRERELLLRMAKEKNVLLVDNAGSLGRNEIDLFALLVSKTPTTLLLSDTDDKLKALHSPQEFIDHLKVKLPPYDRDDLIDMLRKRIEFVGGRGTYPFDDKELMMLMKKADHNPASLLAFARERAIELSVVLAPQTPVSTKPFSITVERGGSSAPSSPAAGTSSSVSASTTPVSSAPAASGSMFTSLIKVQSISADKPAASASTTPPSAAAQPQSASGATTHKAHGKDAAATHKDAGKHATGKDAEKSQHKEQDQPHGKHAAKSEAAQPGSSVKAWPTAPVPPTKPGASDSASRAAQMQADLAAIAEAMGEEAPAQPVHAPVHKAPPVQTIVVHEDPDAEPELDITTPATKGHRLSSRVSPRASPRLSRRALSNKSASRKPVASATKGKATAKATTATKGSKTSSKAATKKPVRKVTSSQKKSAKPTGRLKSRKR